MSPKFSTSTGVIEDTFDHNKGQKSAISGRRLHWNFLNFSSGYFFWLFSRFTVYFSKEMAPKCGESCPISGGEKGVESCHVSGCHGFFGPEL